MSKENTGNAYNESLNSLLKEHSDLEREIDSIGEKKERLFTLKQEIELMEKHQKKAAFESLLSKFDRVMDLYPDHKLNKEDIKVCDDEDVTDVVMNNSLCTDNNPVNGTMCKRCSIIYLRKYIEQEIANFLIM